jgi:predicted Zn-dependent protease
MLFKPLLVAVIAALPILAAACGNQPSEKGAASASETPSATGATVAPDIALAMSDQKFENVSAYGVEYKIESNGSSDQVTGTAAYRGGAAVYARTRYDGDVPADGLTEYLFLPPDLYLQQSDGTWFVQSPWNQGIRPGEAQVTDPNEPLLSYSDLTSHVRELESRPDETSNGRTLARYKGKIELADLPSLGGKDAPGTATANVWMDRDTSLPDKVAIKLDGDQGFTLTISFIHYNEQASAPAVPENARPFRDAVFPDAPCTGSELAACLEAQSDVQGADTCAGTERRVCIAPLGKVSRDLLDHLVEYYRDQFGLSVTVLKPASIPANLEDPKRQQVAADGLITYMGTLFPEAYRDPQAVLIGLTPVDVYDGTSLRYVFGVKGSPFDPKAVVSSARMDPLFYSEPKDNDLFFTRTRKLVSKYIGLLYYRLATSSDPTSPMYGSIGGPNDVDVMTEPLAIPRQ